MLPGPDVEVLDLNIDMFFSLQAHVPMHRVLFGGDHYAWPRNGPPSACRRAGAASGNQVGKAAVRRVGVLRALDLGSDSKSVFHRRLASKQSTQASDCAKPRSLQTPTGASKCAPHHVQKSPSSTNGKEAPTGKRRSGVLGVLSKFLQSTVSPSSTSTVPSASPASARAASATSSAVPAPMTGCKKTLVRAARRAVGACGEDSKVALPDLVGDVGETQEEHKARHPEFQPGCPRCIYYALRIGWEQGYGCHRHQTAGGNEVRTVWLATRPVTLGGVWGLGCVFCAAYMARRAEDATNGPGMKATPGSMGSQRSWAGFEVRALSQMASRAVRQHADTMTHRLAARAYFLPAASNIVIPIQTLNSLALIFMSFVLHVGVWGCVC